MFSPLRNFEPPAFEVGPGGTGSASSASFHAPEGAETDTRLDLIDSLGTFRLAGPPGTSVPVTLDHVVVRARQQIGNLNQTISCDAVGDPLLLGRVTVAGTTLAVSPASPVRSGSDVTLTATVAPAGATGTVDFLDGDDVVGAAPVVDGGASIVTTELAVGARSLTARFHAGIGAPSTTSPAVAFTVLPPPRCAAQAVAGDGAVVRGVYLELVDRCPSAERFGYWTALLGAGTTSSFLAAATAAGPEVEQVMIDDAYRQLLGRASTWAGRAHWIWQLGHRASDAELRANLAASAEFRQRSGGTDGGFVLRAFATVVGREPTTAERATWQARLANGWSRLAVARNLAASGSATRSVAAAAHVDVMGRGPSSTELGAAVRALGPRHDRVGLYVWLVSTPAYRLRAQATRST